MTEFKQKKVKCQKPHRCSWCGGKILIGEEAVYRAGIFEGDFYALYEHTECFDAMTKSNFYEYTFGDQQKGTVMGDEI